MHGARGAKYYNKTVTQSGSTWPAAHSNKHKVPQCTAYGCFSISN